MQGLCSLGKRYSRGLILKGFICMFMLIMNVSSVCALMHDPLISVDILARDVMMTDTTNDLSGKQPWWQQEKIVIPAVVIAVLAVCSTYARGSFQEWWRNTSSHTVDNNALLTKKNNRLSSAAKNNEHSPQSDGLVEVSTGSETENLEKIKESIRVYKASAQGLLHTIEKYKDKPNFSQLGIHSASLMEKMQALSEQGDPAFLKMQNNDAQALVSTLEEALKKVETMYLTIPQLKKKFVDACKQASSQYFFIRDDLSMSPYADVATCDHKEVVTKAQTALEKLVTQAEVELQKYNTLIERAAKGGITTVKAEAGKIKKLEDFRAYLKKTATVVEKAEQGAQKVAQEAAEKMRKQAENVGKKASSFGIAVEVFQKGGAPEHEATISAAVSKLQAKLVDLDHMIITKELIEKALFAEDTLKAQTNLIVKVKEAVEEKKRTRILTEEGLKALAMLNNEQGDFVKRIDAVAAIFAGSTSRLFKPVENFFAAAPKKQIELLGGNDFTKRLFGNTEAFIALVEEVIARKGAHLTQDVLQAIYDKISKPVGLLEGAKTSDGKSLSQVFKQAFLKVTTKK